MRRSCCFLLGPVLSLALGGPAQAAPQPKVAQRAAGRPATIGGMDRKQFRVAMKEYRSEREQSLRARGAFFKKITVQKDWNGERVLFHDRHVTAFLDMTDPMHPRFDAAAEHYDDLAAIPVQRRAHILVVPNQPREHITTTLNAPIGSKDLEETLKVVKSAEALAGRLGIKNARVFVNPADHLSIGYLHVHIIGERAAAYPAQPFNDRSSLHLSQD